jgi:hypothetical protein
MTALKPSPAGVLALAIAMTLLPWCAGADEQKPTPAEQASPSPPRCEVAVVNPVTNYAECVKPRGVPVPQPPPHPLPSATECAQHPDLAVPECQGKD